MGRKWWKARKLPRMPRTDIGMIVMAQFRDPEGNIIGLVEG